MVVRWNTHSELDREAEASAAKLLERPLDAESAVQVALLKNAILQATFEDVGIAQADLVQAGLLSNPILNVNIRFPTRGPSKTYLDFAAAENFLDVFLIPAKEKIAAGQLEAAKARVANEVLDLAARTKSAFYSYQAAQQRIELMQSVVDATAASFEVAKQLREAGNISELQYLAEQAPAGRARVELETAKSDAAEMRERLSSLMGLSGVEGDWTVAGRLPDLPGEDGHFDQLEFVALRRRMDLAAARQELAVQERVLGLTEQTRFVSSLELGAEAERETDGQWRIGPSLSVPVPLFDQGQGTVARAQAVYRQSRDRYIAMAVDVRSQVRAAQAKMRGARSAARLYHDEILPVQQKLLDQTQLQYNGMLVGVFQLLQAKRDQIDAAGRYIDALRDYWVARAELERAIGGRLPDVTQAATRPAGPTTREGSPVHSGAEHHHQHHGE